MSTGLTPETRREKFLAKAAGEASTAPTPITREEIYLDAISGGGGGGGTTNYNDLSNKPSVNNVTLTGNKSTSDLGIDAVPAVGVNDDGKVLKASYTGGVGSYSWQTGSGGGGGTSDYSDLENKPQINSVTLSGNKTTSDLGIDAVPTVGSGDNGKVLTAAYSSDTGSYSWTALSVSAANVSGLATVATSGAYSDLTGLPTLGTAAAAATTDFATAAQGSKADAADTAISTAATGFASLDARLDSMDTTISGKQGALSSTQLDAANSGITSAGVAQIETNKTNISSIQEQVGYAITELEGAL